MGLKYIETIKSIVLLLLVLMSVMFTFTIWTFSPNYEPMEQMQTVDISIAEKKTIDEIIKPYKIITNLKDQVLGSMESRKINTILSEMSTWQLKDLQLVNQDMSKFDVAKVLRQPSQMTLYFPGEVPILVYDNVLMIEDNNIPEATFNRLIIDWSQSTQLPTVHFLSETSGVHYQAQINLPNKSSFLRNVVDVGQSFAEFAEIDRGNAPFLTVSKHPITIPRHTYYQEEVNPLRFRDALFSDPNAVRRSQVDSNEEEYGDDHAFMKVLTKTKMLKYTMPAAESQEIAIPSELLVNTIDFINEHGGWTDEFRYSYMNPISRHVEFQLYVDGLPVYSEQSGTNEIMQKWGDSRVYQYFRPYYTLDVNVETVDVELPSGVEVAEALRDSDDLDFDLIDEITPGYFLIHDDNQRLLILQPCWYYLIKDNWFRFMPEGPSGGDEIGLE
ncbi:YycH family regulatory protein [Sporosarcina obsidiansis]|uniref:YycH family regulatory protein n=1 Tax=Sporosarcina obsidiansis TaxID=2660748 RepID=UPI00129A49E8|nr:two-component system activity regulator YycH [Sporosarcina obsidiansis]